MAIRVFVPDKRDALLQDVLKDLYLLKQAIDYQSGSPDSRLRMIDNIRDKLRTVLNKEDSQK